MNRKGIILGGLLAVLVVLCLGISLIAGMKLPAHYDERNTIPMAQDDPEYAAYVEAWNKCTQLRAACKQYWGGRWPEYFGGLGVVENEGEYLINVYLTEDTEANLAEVSEACGEKIRAHTGTDVSWEKLEQTLKSVDRLKALPFVNVVSMGIEVEERCVRVYLSHKDVFTTAMLAMFTDTQYIDLVIAPVTPTIRSAVYDEAGGVELTMNGMTYMTGCVAQVSNDSLFPEDTIVFECELGGNEEVRTMPLAQGEETYYVRAKSYLVVDGVRYESEWSSLKTIKQP